MFFFNKTKPNNLYYPIALTVNRKENIKDLFFDVFDKNLLSTLDKHYTYVFVLLHKENRIVIRHKINMLVYISRINNETYMEDYTQQFNNVYGIRRPKKINTNTNINDFHPFKRGILIKTLNKETNQLVSYKIDYDNYKNIKTYERFDDFGDSCPDISFRRVGVNAGKIDKETEKAVHIVRTQIKGVIRDTTISRWLPKSMLQDKGDYLFVKMSI